MKELITQYGWQLFVAGDLIIFVLVIYFAKERQENKRIQSMQTDQISMENRTNEKDELTSVFQEKNKRKKSKKRTIFSAGSFSTSTLSSNNSKAMEIVLSKSMIEQLKSFENSNFILKTILKKIFPEQLLQQLVEKALKGELEPGMKVRLKNGNIEISKP